VIPPFRKISGALPPGIHDATWQEVSLRYGYNRPRQLLLRGLGQVISDLRAAGCQRLYIDGSVVMDKPAPGDFDCCWEEIGVNESRLPPEFFDLAYPRLTQKEKYGGEIFPAHWVADPAGTSYLEYFQRSAPPVRRKGIVAINL
jgi:hypothetical protein